MITKINKPCVNCGADKPSDYKEYDGMLGYEAIICKKCGWIYDHNGNYPTDDWSKKFIERREMDNKLCGEDVCDVKRCPDEPAHCDYYREVLIGQAELREKDEVIDDPFGDKPVGWR